MTNPVALLVIDVQIGMFDGEQIPPVYNGPTLLTNTQRLLAQARHTATPIVFVQHMGHPGHPLEPGTPGWPLHPSLTPQTDEPIIQKT
ncbi:MAG: isochorismatase family protein, partial [Anaerolineales bacterium]